MPRRVSAVLLVILVSLLLISPAQSRAQDEAIRIDWPPPVYAVAGTVNIIGTVNPPNLQSYFLEAADTQAQPPVWVPISLPATTPVVDGVLARWMTDLLPDGVYQLRLRVVLTSGEGRFVIVAPIRIANQLERPAGETPPLLVTATPPPPPTPVEPTLVPSPNIVNTLPLPVGGQVTYFDERTIEAMQSAGMTWVKWQIPYTVGSDLVVARDRVNWGHAAGFKVLFSVRGEISQMIEYGDAYYAHFAQFLGQVAALGADAIEVWNEMNLDREWPRGRISPRAYVQDMLRPAYEAIKAANPETLVISGAPAPTGFFGGCTGNGCDDGDYYFGMAQAGVTGYADCIGVHYNEGILPPQQQGGDPRDSYPTRYFPLMTNRAAAPFRASGLPLCYTELGYLSPEGYGPLPANFAWAAGTSVAEQAAWLRDVIALAGEDQRIALIIIFNVDFDRYDQEDPQAGYAIIRADGSCPACEAVATLRRE